MCMFRPDGVTREVLHGSPTGYVWDKRYNARACLGQRYSASDGLVVGLLDRLLDCSVVVSVAVGALRPNPTLADPFIGNVWD